MVKGFGTLCQPTAQYAILFVWRFKVESTLLRHSYRIAVIQKPDNFLIVKRLLWPLPALALAVLLSGCAGRAPTKPSDSNKGTAAPQNTPVIPPVSIAQRLDTKLNIQFDWWKLLQSPQLNMLIEQAFNAHPSVDSAQSILLKLQQSDIARLGFFHSAITVNDALHGENKLSLVQDLATPTDTKFIGDAYYDFHARQLTVGYVPEVLRASTLSLPKTEAELRQLQLEATYRTLASNLIACVIQEASLRAQMVAARKVAAIDQSLLAISRKQQRAGLVTQSNVAAQQASAERSAQALLIIKAQFEQTRELLHLLLGIAPDVDLPPTFELATLHLSEELPLELPAALVVQRPDVRAAQLDMQPTSVKYQTTENVALKNAEDTLHTIYNDAIALKAAAASEQDHLAMLESARKQYAAKTANYADLLAAEQNVQLARLRFAQVRARQLGNAIALYHAVGGAWWNTDNVVTLEIARELGKR